MANSDPKTWSKGLHDARGSGGGWRTRLDLARLKEVGGKLNLGNQETKSTSSMSTPKAANSKALRTWSGSWEWMAPWLNF